MSAQGHTSIIMMRIMTPESQWTLMPRLLSPVVPRPPPPSHDPSTHVVLGFLISVSGEKCPDHLKVAFRAGPNEGCAAVL